MAADSGIPSRCFSFAVGQERLHSSFGNVTRHEFHSASDDQAARSSSTVCLPRCVAYDGRSHTGGYSRPGTARSPVRLRLPRVCSFSRGSVDTLFIVDAAQAAGAVRLGQFRVFGGNRRHSLLRCLMVCLDYDLSAVPIVPNPAASVDAPIASLFQVVHHWRRATDQRR